MFNRKTKTVEIGNYRRYTISECLLKDGSLMDRSDSSGVGVHCSTVVKLHSIERNKINFDVEAILKQLLNEPKKMMFF